MLGLGNATTGSGTEPYAKTSIIEPRRVSLGCVLQSCDVGTPSVECAIAIRVGGTGYLASSPETSIS